MLQWWTDRQQHRRKAKALYDVAAVASRRTELFWGYRVPDSFDGRFESLLLHSFLIFRRLKAVPNGDRQAQAFFDAVFRQVELAVREIGVGDLAVSKHVKRMMTACQGRTLVYDHALNQQDNDSLIAALGRNVYGTLQNVPPEVVTALAGYVRAQDDAFKALPDPIFTAAEFTFNPLPKAPVVAEAVSGDTSWQSAA
jgi:cytochrome b pre-mRNA-processing protein 3